MYGTTISPSQSNRFRTLISGQASKWNVHDITVEMGENQFGTIFSNPQSYLISLSLFNPGSIVDGITANLPTCKGISLLSVDIPIATQGDWNCFHTPKSQWYIVKNISFLGTPKSDDGDSSVWGGNSTVININNGKALDSAYHYLDKCMDYIDYIPLHEKSAFYNQVATMYMGIDKKKTEEYVLRGYKLGKSCVGCSILAQLYHERGEVAKADTLFAQALSLAKCTRDSVYVLSYMVDAYAGVHDYQRAFSGFKLLYNTHKQLDKTIKENDTKAVQLSFDAEMERLRQSNISFRVIIGVSFLAMIFFCLWLYRRYRFNEVSRKVMEDELLIRTYQEKIEETDISQVKERAHYARKLSKLQEHQSRMLAKGRCLYRHIMSGGTIVTWSKDDMKHFMEYFKLVDLSFVKRLEEDYDHLSLRYKFYMVLVHMGKNDEEVQCVMGISPSSVRSIKSRIKSKYKGS